MAQIHAIPRIWLEIRVFWVQNMALLSHIMSARVLTLLTIGARLYRTSWFSANLMIYIKSLFNL